MNETLAPILYAEDDENDAFLMERAFQRVGLKNPLQIVADGQEAIDYLAGEGRYADRGEFPVPCLLLLDVQLPRKSGLEVLKWLRNTPAVCTLPAVMLTSSAQDTDVHRAYIMGANGYLVKPGGPDDLETLVRAIRDYWVLANRGVADCLKFAVPPDAP